MDNINCHQVNSADNDNNHLCYYRNNGPTLQQIVISGASEKEKLIFPGEQLLFWANPRDKLTIKARQSDNIIVNSVVCEHLLVQ